MKTANKKKRGKWTLMTAGPLPQSPQYPRDFLYALASSRFSHKRLGQAKRRDTNKNVLLVSSRRCFGKKFKHVYTERWEYLELPSSLQGVMKDIKLPLLSVVPEPEEWGGGGGGEGGLPFEGGWDARRLSQWFKLRILVSLGVSAIFFATEVSFRVARKELIINSHYFPVCVRMVTLRSKKIAWRPDWSP